MSEQKITGINENQKPIDLESSAYPKNLSALGNCMNLDALPPRRS